MSEYLRRHIDDELDELMPHLAAISIDGPKGVGKTATASQRARSVLRLDDEADSEIVRSAPERLGRMQRPLLIDEWQRAPEVWDLVRRRVDADASGGQFLLTGSATPTGAPIHSGAGRIVSLRMRPMSLAERGLESPTVRVKDLLAGRASVDGTTAVTVSDYAREIVSSGFPGIRSLPPRARRAQLDSYIDRIIDREFAEHGQRVRRPETLRAWLTAYAAAIASTASYATILEAATPGQPDKPARSTTTHYRDILTELWLLDPVGAWYPTQRTFARLGSTPKHFLADTALAARLLGLDEEQILGGLSNGVIGPQAGTQLGRLFESLVALSLKSYAQTNEATLSHFRTRNGDREIDYILHRGNREVVGVEVKLARTVADSDVKHLLWLKTQLGDALRDMVVIYTGATAYRRPDGVAVVPAALLGA